MKTLLLAGSLLALVGAGCAAATPPPELVSARVAYDRATKGPAPQYDPTDLHIAKEALDVAEQSFADAGDSQDTRDVAYTSERRTQVAESRARALMAIGLKERTVAEMNVAQGAQVRATSAALGAARQDLATEQQRRADAERRAAEAAAALARLGEVKKEARGVVMTLSGGVLFVSAKSELLPTAQAKLVEVAEALTKTDPDSKILIEGFTDSQGSAASNQTLSEARAQAVRSFLVSHGVAADRVTSRGYGPASPIADNASPEGRANNRRVQIVITPAR